MRRFASIGQFRSAIHNVNHRATFAGRDADGNPTFDLSKSKPILKYRGTVKLHGTNSACIYNVLEDSFTYQSRERVLSLTQDNACFMLNMMSKEDTLRSLFHQLLDKHIGVNELIPKEVALYFEWAGQGIQKGVAVAQLEKFAAIIGAKFYFDAEVGDESAEQDPNAEEFGMWVDFAGISAPEQRIFNILDFPTWEVDIDFSRPQLAQADLEKLTRDIGTECPVGKQFGILGLGEGLVWRPLNPAYDRSANWFKTKDERHSVSKVKTLVPVDVEAAKSLYDFVDRTVTEARLEQGLHVLKAELQLPFDMTSMGAFLRWVVNDILREEQDVIILSQFDIKKLNSSISAAARPWFISKYNSPSNEFA
jgi:hypothetical protein